MRHLLFIAFILAFPGFGLAACSVPNAPNYQGQFSSAISAERPEKTGFFKQLRAIKAIKKPFNAAEKGTGKAIPRSEGSDGRVLAAISFFAGLSLVLFWLFYPILGFILSVPVGLIGIVLSTIALIKARGWRGTKRTRALAMIGLVINGLAAVITIIVWQMAFGG